MPTSTIWEIEPHTSAKHEILRRYLDAWYPIMTSWSGRVVFCDGFAGPGRYSGGEPGSPLIALEALHEHPYRYRFKAEIRFLFIEKDDDRCEALRNNVNTYLAEIGEVYPVRIECQTFDETLTKILDDMDEKGSRMAPTLCFVDPFGVSGVKLESLRRLMLNPQCELLITLMTNWLDRFATTPEFESHTNELFGTDEWKQGREKPKQTRIEHLRQLYQSQLQTVVGAKYVRYFTMFDYRNLPIYHLFFASTHWTGVDRMKKAMWKVDSTGAYQFADATSPDQRVLLGRQTVDRELIDMLFERFNGTEQIWRDVEEAIRQSPYLVSNKNIIKRYARDHSDELTIEQEPGRRVRTLTDRAILRFHRQGA